jgi:hypothetical protein
MKTAMQILITELEKIKDYHPTFLLAISTANDLLEKEKAQIMNAYCDGAKGGANGTKGQHEFGWVSRHTRKKYYNQTYNQNK